MGTLTTPTGTRGNAAFLLVPLFLLVAGCADTVGLATQQDLAELREEAAQLRQDLSGLTLSLNRARAEIATGLSQVERQSRDQQVESQRQLALLQSRSDTLAADLARLTKRLDELSQDVARLRRPAPAASAQPGPPPPPAGPPPSAPAGGVQPKEIFQVAYLDYSKGNYPLAVDAFREFIRRFPDSDLAERAQYLIGEAYFNQASQHVSKGEPEKAGTAFEQAVQEFRKVTVNYPRGEKVAAALYKEALALLALKRPALARARLQYLLDHFPQSEEAPLARERLAALKESGER